MGVGHVTSGHRGSKALVGAFVGGTSVVAALASPTPALALDLTTPQLATQDGSPSFAQGLLTCAPLVREQPSRVDVSGAAANASQLRPLDEAIGAIEGQGHQVGFVMVDLGSGATVSYHADDAFYSASSIKGPYVVSVVQNVLGDGAPADGRIDAILRYSDNDAYASFRSSYTDAPMHALVDASGAEQMANSGITEVVEASAAPAREGGIADNFYEFVTPRQLAALWQQCHAYLASDEPGAAWLADELTHPEVSSLRHVGCAWGTTWSKAGWYPDDDAAFSTTVDAGVARTATGDVAIAVMTTAPEDFSVTASVIAPLLVLHAEMAE